ncbi:DUF6449 domain-containing protein [Pseudobacillus wudalianchiensis]|uniref:Multidrug ABC transporter permease n=1 Tax=Pseudobacillus wudalianchiensis TaxID=1743143 RepID=A0A1B9AGF7_9BACI|nr:DUF6449 domain-containing protein [Bacillus wudalianchiensis]OCA82925.1 hypothetical protein A8F95_14480 [Bacillus wudalianchiensis]
MKSGTLSFNKGLFQQHARSVLWISIFFALALLLVLPLGMWMIYMNAESMDIYLPHKGKNGVFTFSYPYQFITFLVFPVITGLVLTSYMTKKGSSDFMHSLPFKRETLLTHVYAAGGIALILPILLTGAVLVIIHPFMTPPLYTMGNIVGWIGISLLIVLFMFTVTIFVGLFIGSTLIQGVMAYGILILPGALIMLALGNARFFINGLAADAYIDRVMTKGIFLVRASSITEKPFSSLELALYIGLIVLLIAVSYFIYKIRPAEAVDETIAFPFFRSLFIFSLTLFVMLASGLYFAEFLNGAFGWTLFGYAIGAFVGYTIMQMIVQKTLRLSWPWKGFVLYAAAVIVLLIPTAILAGTYEKKIPAENEIAAVYAGDSISYDSTYLPESTAIDKKRFGEMKEKESIRQTISLHKQLMKEGHPSKQRNYQVGIVYKLKDGSRIDRQYYLDAEQVTEMTKELRSNQEFKQKTSPIFAITRPEKISYLAVADFQGTRDLRVTDQEEMKGLIQAVKRDTLTEASRRFVIYDLSQVGEVQIWFTNGHMMSVPIYLDQEQTMRYIHEKVRGGTNFASAEQVEEAYILTTDTSDRREQLMTYINENSFSEKESELSDIPVPAEKVMDSGQLKQLLDPAHLEQEGNKSLLIRWKGNRQVSIVGVKE